jgi:hypothetical protein
MHGPQVRRFDRALYLLALLLVPLAIVAHGGGHVSMDSSEQLYEAATGRSVSWSPPFMSALLRVLGGGTQATAAFVACCTLLTYGGLLLAWRAGSRTHAGRGPGIAATLAGLVLVANPLVFLYVGILWKDVMLASLLAAVSGLLLAASGAPRRASFACASLACLLLVPLLLVRQQGILLAPPLLAVAATLIAGARRPGLDVAWMGRWLAVVVVFAVLAWATSLGVRQVIHGALEKSTDVGIAAVMRYDLSGMLAYGRAPAPDLPDDLRDPRVIAAMKHTYSADRLDFVLNDPEVGLGFQRMDLAADKRAWWAQVRADPLVFARVKAEQFAWLVGLRRLDRCLPVHVGVEGNPEYLRAAGVAEGVEPEDLRLYRFAMWARHLVLYRHWFYLALLVGVAGYLLAGWRRRAFAPAPTVALGGMVLGLCAFYGAYLLTTIACDFRYLYPGLVGTSCLVLYLLAAGRRPGMPPTPRS